jgi:hypothetical protein
MVTTILDSVYARGSVTARQHAVLDPKERSRNGSILRHLPAGNRHADFWSSKPLIVYCCYDYAYYY